MNAPNTTILPPSFQPHSSWSREAVAAIYHQPFSDLMFQAQSVHREYFDPNEVQLSTLLNIKTGGCPEDCGYCPQSVRFKTGLDADALMDRETVLGAAQAAKAAGATRFCMGAAWRSPKDRDIDKVTPLVEAVRDLGMEVCVTLGMLEEHQAERLRDSGVDYYNHNLDTSPEYYGNVITTRTYQQRLDTLDNVREAGMKVCCGGIVGLGESADDRVGLLTQLASMPAHPESVPINMLVKVAGTPMADNQDVDPIEFVRTIATARIVMPKSHVRLSAGRTSMTDEMQALCFVAGANSIFYGEQLLTTDNPISSADRDLFERLGITPSAASHDN
ncbi:MAG: biotin synthase BioB [Pseudomonadota bacterium]